MVKITKKFWTNYFIWILVVISWVTFFIIKNNENVNSKTFLIVSAILSVGAIAVIIVRNFPNFMSQAETEFSKLTQEDIKKLINEEANSRWNNVSKSKAYEWVKTKTVNEDLIYAVAVNLNLDDEKFIIIVNASEPKITPTINDFYDSNGVPVSESEINKLMNNKARKPIADPNISRIVTRRDEFGRPIEEREDLSYEKPKKEEVKEEL